ncbi:MAG TPA: gliding motility-associated C-terminal domain-containing protein, partial [Bacteroidales bacterium]|nr:gliding motility-associated C-terminal domain-containing protein [Bacteroidales bacterium]
NAGTSPYTYLWSTTPAQTAATATGLVAGSYIVTVTDANGCSTLATTVITQPAGALNAAITAQTNVLCFGNATGSATVTANAGTSPYTYLWSTTPAQTAATATGLVAGSYNVTVTDANGCSTLATTVITQPAGALNAAITAQTNVLCFGNATGSATVTANAGTSPYTYLWSSTPAQTTATATGLVAGSYNVTVTDANGCTTAVSVIITQPQLLTANVTNYINESCVGMQDGMAMVTVNGGTQPYHYNWSNGFNTATISGLSAGNYSVSVTDNNGCIATASITLTAPIPIDPNFAPIADICYGSLAPILLPISPNGIPGSWNPPVINNMVSGTYTFTPAAGQCANSQTLNVTITPQAIPNINPIPPFCAGTIAPTLPNPSGISGNWYPATIDNYTSGFYTFTPLFGECAVPQTLHVVVIPPTVPDFEPIPDFCEQSVAPALNHISPNGIIGTWSPDIINNTTSGSYIFTPLPSQCATSQTLNVTIIQKAVPEFSPVPPLCVGSPAPVLNTTSLNGISGTWNPPAINNITSGLYTFTPDTGVCATNNTIAVTVNPLPSIATVAFPSTVCLGHNTTLGAVGADTYTWAPGNLNGSSVIVAPTTATVYSVTGTSLAGCTGSATVAVNIAPEVSMDFITTPKVGCYPLDVQFSFVPNGLVDTNSLHWNFDDPSTTNDISNLTEPGYTYTDKGHYVVTLYGVSIYGCNLVAYDTVIVRPGPVADFTTHPEAGETNDPRIYFYDQSIDAVSWQWNFGNPQSGNDNFSDLQNPSHNYTDSGTFYVQLIVANEFNCLDSVAKPIRIYESYAFFVPNAFTPDGDGINEGFRGKGVGIDENSFEMYIYDRWGKLMFKTNDLYSEWDGINYNNGADCEMGVYVWLISFREKTGLRHDLKGFVTLVR